MSFTEPMLKKGEGGTLQIEGVHDYAQVYVDQKLVGTLDRRLDRTSVELPRLDHAATLDILVENTGSALNYSHAILTERAGLTGKAHARRQGACKLADLFPAHERPLASEVQRGALHGAMLFSGQR